MRMRCRVAQTRLPRRSQIAMFFGFEELGRFSVRYRQMFGRRPSLTWTNASPPSRMVHSGPSASITRSFVARFGPPELRKVHKLFALYFFTLITNSFHSSGCAPVAIGVKRTPPTNFPSPLAPSNLPVPPTTMAGASGKTVVVPSGLAVPSTLIQRVESLEGVTLKYV